MISALAALALLLPASLPNDPLPNGDVWPQWRGPERDGQASGPAWPASLAPEHLKVRWSADCPGPSYSGPIVTERAVFTTATRDESHEVVLAYDRKTGRELWGTEWEGAMEVTDIGKPNGSWIRATPAYANGKLYVAGMRDVVVCLDAQSGEILWTADLMERAGSPIPAFGQVSSPLVDGDRVFVQAGAALVALDAESGATLWTSLKDAGGMMSALACPMIAEIGGQRQLVVQARERLAGLTLDGGEELWSVRTEADYECSILTPTILGDTILIGPYGKKSELIGVIRNDDGSFEAETAWLSRAQGYMSTPVVVDGHAYLFQKSNRFACIDLTDGEVPWISPPTGEKYSSLVARGNRILALGDSGTLRLIEATPAEYKVLDEVEVSDSWTWAHLAVAGQDIAIRDESRLVVYDWR